MLPTSLNNGRWILALSFPGRFSIYLTFSFAFLRSCLPFLQKSILTTATSCSIPFFHLLFEILFDCLYALFYAWTPCFHIFDCFLQTGIKEFVKLCSQGLFLLNVRLVSNLAVIFLE